jgi:hypothetical protein
MYVHTYCFKTNSSLNDCIFIRGGGEGGVWIQTNPTFEKSLFRCFEVTMTSVDLINNKSFQNLIWHADFLFYQIVLKEHHKLLYINYSLFPEIGYKI